MNKLPEAAPCRCPAQNAECMRAGKPMVGRLWEYCSGQCPPERPCKPNTSNDLRYEWDRRSAAIAKGEDPFPARPSPGLGDAVESALTKFGITKAKIEAWLGRPCGCTERQEKLNKLGRWASRVLGMSNPPAPSV